MGGLQPVSFKNGRFLRGRFSGELEKGAVSRGAAVSCGHGVAMSRGCSVGVLRGLGWFLSRCSLWEMSLES